MWKLIPSLGESRVEDIAQQLQWNKGTAERHFAGLKFQGPESLSTQVVLLVLMRGYCKAS